MKYISVVDYKNTEIVNDALISFNEANDGSISVKITKEKQSNDGVKIKAVCTAQKAIKNCADGFMPNLFQAVIDNHIYSVKDLRKTGIDKLTASNVKCRFDRHLNTVTEALALSAKGKKSL